MHKVSEVQRTAGVRVLLTLDTNLQGEPSCGYIVLSMDEVIKHKLFIMFEVTFVPHWWQWQWAWTSQVNVDHTKGQHPSDQLLLAKE